MGGDSPSLLGAVDTCRLCDCVSVCCLLSRGNRGITWGGGFGAVHDISLDADLITCKHIIVDTDGLHLPVPRLLHIYSLLPLGLSS